MELFSRLKRRKKAQSDEETQDRIQSYLADEYDKAAALHMQMFLNMDLPQQFIPSLADHTQEGKIRKILKGTIPDIPFEINLSKGQAGGVWTQDYEISRHVINIADSVISIPQTGDRLRFAQIEIFLHNREGANVLAFSRLNDKYWALIRVATLNQLPGLRKGNIDGPVSLYNQGIFSQLYQVLKSSNCQGFTAPDFENFIVAPLSAVAVESRLSNSSVIRTV